MTEERAPRSVKEATATLQVRDGTQMNAYVARPSEGGSIQGCWYSRKRSA